MDMREQVARAERERDQAVRAAEELRREAAFFPGPEQELQTALQRKFEAHKARMDELKRMHGSMAREEDRQVAEALQRMEFGGDQRDPWEFYSAAAQRAQFDQLVGEKPRSWKEDLRPPPDKRWPPMEQACSSPGRLKRKSAPSGGAPKEWLRGYDMQKCKDHVDMIRNVVEASAGVLVPRGTSSGFRARVAELAMHTLDNAAYIFPEWSEGSAGPLLAMARDDLLGGMRACDSPEAAARMAVARLKGAQREVVEATMARSVALANNQALVAAMQQAARAGGGAGPSMPQYYPRMPMPPPGMGPPQPRWAGGGGPSGGGGSMEVCKLWRTPEGCRFGASCKYVASHTPK